MTIRRTRALPWPPSARVNAVLLIASFALGQGAIFLVQTVLIGHGALDLLAGFASHFSFAILALMIVDAGLPVVLARCMALAGGDAACAIGRSSYWQACCVRVPVAVALAVVAVGYALLSADGFSRTYVPAAIPALFAWAFNATGLLDGMGFSGVSGLTVMLAYMASALALALSLLYPAADAGLLLGAGLSIGYALAVLAQLATLARLGRFPQPVSVSRPDCLGLAREGFGVLLAVVPGQLSFRFQIVVCAMLFGPAMTASFLYGRQIAAAVSQVLDFVRRAHFPAMVRELAEGRASLHGALHAQRPATFLAGLFAIGLLAAGLAGMVFAQGAFSDALAVVALYAVGVLTGALSQTIGQAAQARGHFEIVAVAGVAGMLVGFGASVALALAFGLAGLATAEVLTHAILVLVVDMAVFRRGRHPGDARAGA